ncbi:MAG: glutamine-hydrolyzing GMP synthase [Frankia sp.]
MTADTCLVLDLGSPYAQGLARSVRRRGVYTQIEPATISAERLKTLNPHAIILAGCHSGDCTSVPATVSQDLLQAGIPVLAVCHDTLITAGSDRPDTGPTTPHAAEGIELAQVRVRCASPLLGDLSPGDEFSVPIRAEAGLEALPVTSRVLAETTTGPVIAADDARRIYWLNFNPDLPPGLSDGEVLDVLGNFLFDIAQFTATWTMAHFLDEAITRLRAQIGDGHVVLGLSGGVDSLVTAALLHRAVGEQLTCVLVDNGFLRAGEREAVEATFRKLIPGRLCVVDARQTFLSALAGAAPGQKRRIIRREFLSVFEQQAAQIPNATFLAQGIIYSDLIGTAPARDPGPPTPSPGHTHPAEQPPTGDLPRSATLEPIQPLRELFKDEVRELGAILDLPHNLLWRQPFPGPGLAVRCVGQVTKPRLDTLRAADYIISQEIKHANLPQPIFQSFAVLLPVQSVTATGGHSTAGETICLRVVESDDGAIANWIPLPANLLNTISTRLMTQIPGITRVVYDITTKPPGRIEWE